MGLKELLGTEVLSQIESRLPGSTVEANETSVVIKNEAVPDVMSLLKSSPDFAFNYLTMVTAVDYLDYFEQMLSVSRARPDLVELQCRTVLPEQADPEAADTNFERKYLLQGRPIYIADYQKPAA